MAKKEEKKGIFGKAVDALSNRDEKEAAEAAKRAEAEARVKAASASREAAKAKAQAAQAEAKLKEMEAEKAKEKQQEERVAAAKAAEEWRAKQAPKMIAEHTLTATETLSHLSLKYYGSATRPYWMVIYEANKEAIGDNPAHVRVGMKLQIPELPEELKKDK